MKPLAGFWLYTRFILERERIISAIWIVAMAASAVGFAAMYPSLFSTSTELSGMAQTMNTPAMVALMGPVYGLDSLTTAMVMAQTCLIWFAIASAIMNIFFVNRYTRADEELGRLEMFRALPMGRLANIAATLFCVLLLNVLIASLTMAGLLAINIGGTSIHGAFAYSFAIGAIGFSFAGITLLLAQLVSSSRGVLGAAFALFGLFYIIRAWGDMQGNDASYLSPIGLGLKVSAFYDNNLWLLAVLFGIAILITIVAGVVYVKRDLGAGVIPAKPGRKHASPLLKSPFGLAWRLTRGAVAAWAIAAVVAGAVYGSIVGELQSFLSNNAMMQQMVQGSDGGNSLVNDYITMLFSIMALLAAVPVINAAMKIHSEEKHGRIEQVYATATSRIGLYAGFIVIALLQSVLFMVLSTLGMYASGYSTGLLVLTDLFKASLVYLPALWVMLGVSVALVGLLPRLSVAIWVVYAYSFVIIYFGRMFKLPDWATNISPFGSVPQLPVADFNAVPLAVLAAIAVALTLVGLAAYRLRDLR
ncbi:MAG: ABC transporter permease [Coriobacteriia bacterium]|nr:ABC transporter permease [Coriobacteriia bacterium]MCL2751084.1 ABC transporter permease [Coriobacteriia bacterium]